MDMAENMVPGLHKLFSAIFVASDKEREIVEHFRRGIEEQFPAKKVVTSILPAITFYSIKGEESCQPCFFGTS